MGRLLVLASIAMFVLSGRTGAAESPSARTFFHQRIEPILVAHCLKCHSDAAKGGLDLRSRGKLISGGDSGPVIAAGRPENSLLYQYVSTKEMPPEEPLSAEQIGAIEQWIRDGAYFPEQDVNPFSITTDRRAGFDWWSLQPLADAELPAAPEPWSKNPIDRFIYARLEQAGIQPSPPADPRTLIRRATYDLLGLPPTPQQVLDFIAACRQETGQADQVGDQTYQKLIDELLQSPHYGEHWGRHWLDVVRFGESNGFERNVIHENVWPFRDYVIRSLNQDKPFNRFAIEHLAGDAFGADDPEVAVGTAFLVCGPYDNVGNQDKNAAAQIRANTIDEMIRATSEAFLGMTVGCSRCHDHKFDPISQRDYYAMYATFAGVQHGQRTLKNNQREPATKIEGEGLRAPVSAKINTEQFDPIEARFIRFTISATNASEPCLDELEIFTAASEDAPSVNVAAAAVGAKPTSSGDYAGNPFHKLIHINDGKYGNAHSWISNENGKGWVQIELAETRRIDRIVWGRDRDEQFRDRLATSYQIEVATEPEQWQTVASSADRQPFVRDASSDPNALNWWVGNFRQENGPFHVFVGGSPQRIGDEVTPSSLTMLDQTTDRYQLPANAPELQRRLKLAQWIVADDNPTTPRVLVNRLWHHHFGTGIVNTPSDFGFLGDRPSHPELLDWLALTFQAEGWRLKPMHRRIMLSRTYRQSSEYRVEAANLDGESRLLWRFPPRRLSGEEIRDSTLSVAGKLDTRMGGPGFRLFRYVQDNVATYHPLDQHGPETYRRAVYHHNARAMQIDLMSEFDTPDCAFSTPRRSSTTTPLQALTLMNHSFTTDMADALAERIEQESSDAEEQINRAFWLVFLRDPTDPELSAAKALVDAYGTNALCRALLNANEFIYVD